jgi:hypothetical protein
VGGSRPRPRRYARFNFNHVDHVKNNDGRNL